MVEVSRNFPPANVGARDEAHLRLTGALARLDEEEYPTDLLDKFHERFCEAIGDTKEIKNRLKINRQRKALASGKKVYGITDLREHLDSELEAYNLLFEQKEEELQEVALVLGDNGRDDGRAVLLHVHGGTAQQQDAIGQGVGTRSAHQRAARKINRLWHGDATTEFEEGACCHLRWKQRRAQGIG